MVPVALVVLVVPVALAGPVVLVVLVVLVAKAVKAVLVVRALRAALVALVVLVLRAELVVLVVLVVLALKAELVVKVAKAVKAAPVAWSMAEPCDGPPCVPDDRDVARRAEEDADCVVCFTTIIGTGRLRRRGWRGSTGAHPGQGEQSSPIH